MYWFLDEPTLFARELRAFEELASQGGLTYTWRIGGDALLVDVDFEIYGVVRHGVLRYPAAFPYALPYIRPRDPTEVWSGHQFGVGGPLCLEWRADNWNPDLTGADIMRSAFKLLKTEQHPLAPAPVLSAHRQSTGQGLRGARERLVLTPDLVATISGWSPGTTTRCEVVCVAHETTRIHFVASVRTGDADVAVADVPAAPSAADALEGWPIAGLLYRADSWSEHRYLETVDDLNHVLVAHGFEPSSLGDLADASGGTTLIVLAGSSSDSWIAYTVSTSTPKALEIVATVQSGNTSSRLPDDQAVLAATRVAVVGLGSLGSKIAVSLARSGVRRFVLVDDDVLLGENIVRHDLDWTAVGEHKAVSVATKLKRIAPGVETVVHTQSIDGQQSPTGAALILDAIAACDLIIDATANPHVFLRLGGLARMSKTAMVWAEVYAGGLGGVVARARPRLDPNPYTVRNGLIDYVRHLPEAPFTTATGYDNAGDVPVLAYDTDVSYIAAAAAHLALDTALKREPSLFPVPAYRFGLRAGWDFSGPFEAVPIAIAGPGWDFEITEQNLEDVRQATDVVKALLESHQNAARPPAA